jgi:hypothetical protein
MGRVIVDRYLGAGGPAEVRTGLDGFEAGPTDAGTFVIASTGQHSSARYPTWSKIRWGSPLRVAPDGHVEVLHEGQWRRLDSFPNAPSVDDLKQRYLELYGEEEVPKTWVFNDFGHLTVYYFKDLNRNRRLDGREAIHGEFIHSTPDNEAQEAQGRSPELAESHGCIHALPSNLDEMKRKGYLERGNTLVVHAYSEEAPLDTPIEPGKPPFEVHFYPGAQHFVIFGQSPG